MQKKIFLAFCMIFLFIISGMHSYGQKCTVYYCSGCVSNGLCPVSRTFSSYEEAKASALQACPYATPDIRCGGDNDKREVLKSPVGDGIMGGLLLGLVGSFMTDASGKNLAPAYGAGGYFIFSTLPLVINPTPRPVGVNIIIGALTFAAGAYATVHAMDVIKNQNTTTPTPLKAETELLVTGGGALGGALIGATLFPKKQTKGGLGLLNRKKHLFGNMAFVMSGNRFGIVVRL
ncbi:MAG: hypothetical protein IPP73_15985 [Chitinophagaceae bacterium]|nr:hypothetical protein [Chitinophagaceae bacterium]